jgi:hypothetical protein
MPGVDLAFRTQLVIPEQLELYDYWLNCAHGRQMPGRIDIHPQHIPRLLPHISLIDVEAQPTRYRVRLAGTQLYDFYGCDITGFYVDDVCWGDKERYWKAAYQRVTSQGRPAQGIVRSPVANKDHLVQFWIRLPLSVDGKTVSMILSHDAFVPVSKVARLTGMDEVKEVELEAAAV